MRRSLVVGLAVVLVLAPLAGVAGGSLSSPDTTSDDLDVFFVDGNGNLKYTDAAGNVVDTGKQAESVGGTGDVDGDGRLELAYASTQGDLLLLDENGAVTNTGAPADRVGGITDFDGDGRLEILTQSGAQLNTNEDSGLDTVVEQSIANVGGVGDVDSDGLPEVAFQEGDVLRVKDTNGNEKRIAGSLNNKVGGVGGIADVDGDGTLEIAIKIDGTLAMAEYGGSVTDTGLAVHFRLVGGVGDLDADGTEEAVYVDNSDETVNYATQSGSRTDIGVSSNTNDGVGAVVDWDGDGFARDDAPTVSNPSPSSTTTSSDPVTLSVDVSDPELPVGDTVTVDIDHNGNDATQTTISSAQTVTATVQDVADGSNSWSVTVTDAGGNSNSQTYSYTADYDAPTLSNPDPTGNISTYDGDVSIDVSDPDFSSGDSVTVTVTDTNNNQIGQRTVSSNGTVDVQYVVKGGANNLTWTATDSHGLSATPTDHDFDGPTFLRVENESAPGSLVTTQANITATFFASGSSTVVKKTSTTGRFDFRGLPAAKRYIVNVNANGHRQRQTVITSLFDQQTVYLLPNSADASQIVFKLSDPTGEFPPGDTRLYIEKPIRVNNSTTYKTVSAGTFGATAAYSVILADGVRYRLRLRHDGQERILGSYTPTAATTELLRVQRIEPSADDVPQDAVYGSVEDGQLAVRFRGGDNDTTVQYRVTNSSGAVVVPQTNTTGASFAHVYPVPNNSTDSYNVSYEVVDGGETVRDGSFVAGDVAGIAGRFNMDGQLLSLLSWFAIMATLGLVVIVDTRLAPAAGTGMASALAILGTVAIPAPLLGVSGVVAVLALFGRPS